MADNRTIVFRLRPVAQLDHRHLAVSTDVEDASWTTHVMVMPSQ